MRISLVRHPTTRAAAVAVVVIVLGVARATPAENVLEIAMAARSVRPGEVVVFTASAGTQFETLRARAFDHDLPTFRLDARTWQAILGLDLGIAAGSYAVSFDGRVDGHDVTRTITLAVRKRVFPTRTLRVDGAFVNPPEQTLQRITAETEELDRVWEQSAQSRLWSGAFVRPVPGAATSSFGTRSIFNGSPRQPHGGTDFLSPSGTPVHAPNSGRVVLAGALYFTGNTVVIDHGLGVLSLLAHLAAMHVHDGDRVTAGQIIGQVGTTGRATGPHLHWAVRIGGARVDPLAVLAIVR